ncbi:GNAT family N-acetyltransferase [Streptacidiphilus sp. N1-3]|uniref:GNAT family N-acetyltransferase n=1 Tax=Streptacidiphilus alkalitolerans TaxID=3342712 RepID=A0ABV6X573_9ACTN
MPPTIRPYRPADHDAMYDICIRTGNHGGDATGLYTDPRILPDIFTGPYLALEPQLAFVLTDSGDRAIGYVIGTADTPAFVTAYRERWLPTVADRYPEGGGNERDAQRIGELRHPEWMWSEAVADYPAHLHIDLLPEAQGRGAGRAMIEHFLAALRALGVRRVHLGMSSANTGARAFYDRLGFHELSRSEFGVLMGRSTD